MVEAQGRNDRQARLRHQHAAPLRQGMQPCAHHTRIATATADCFELYECDVCSELQDVRVGQECSHVCRGVEEDSDASDDTDGECAACGQLAAWCVCGQEWDWEYASHTLSESACMWHELTDEQLPHGVSRDENGELYDEDY